MQKQPSERFFKKCFMRNFPELAKKHLCRNLFFDEVKLCRSATSLKTSLQSRCSWRNLRNLLTEHLFAEHYRTTSSHCSSNDSSEGRIGKQNYQKGQSRRKNRFQKQLFSDFKLGVLKNFVSFTRKYLCQSLFLTKLHA